MGVQIPATFTQPVSAPEVGCDARRLLVRRALPDVARDGGEPLAQLVYPRRETLLVAVETSRP